MCNHVCGQGRDCTCGVETPREKFWWDALEYLVIAIFGIFLGVLFAWRG